MPKFEQKALRRLDELIDLSKRVKSTRGFKGVASGITRARAPVNLQLSQQFYSSAKNFIHTVLGDKSTYFRDLPEFSADYETAEQISGMLESLKEEANGGLLFDRDLFITADNFDDILEQAEYLLDKGYKDAAASLAGAILESTLRKMCLKRGIALGGRETIEPLNVSLAKADPPAYTTLVQKQITGWADIRNNADHGHFDKYSQNDVADMLKWVRSFVEQHLR